MVLVVLEVPASVAVVLAAVASAVAVLVAVVAASVAHADSNLKFGTVISDETKRIVYLLI